MLMEKVWLFIVVEILIVTAISSLNEDSGVGNSFPGGYEIEQRSTNHSAGTPLYQVAAEQLVLDGSDNLSDLTGNLTNLPGVPGLDNAYSTAIGDTFESALSRGHMNPLGLNTFDKAFMKATFTLSNAVPQFKTSNRRWETFETRIRKYAKNTCGPRGGILYLLTGKSDYGVRIQDRGPEQDSATALPYLREHFPGNVRLVTPRAVWTAGCCVWAEPGKYFGRLWSVKKAKSFAVMSNNKNNDALLHQTEMSVSQLERLLKPPAHLKEVDLFPGNKDCLRAENNIELPQ